MARQGRGNRHLTPASHPAEREGESPSATRVVLEGNDALEKVAKLLRTPESPTRPGSTADGLRALARALQESRGDLPAKLERLLRPLEGDRGEFLAEILRLEARDSGAFFAGALAGYVLAMGGPPSSTRPEDATPEPRRHSPPGGEAPVDTGIAGRPIRSAQIGSGGLGSLEAPAQGPDTPPSARQAD